jgi:hypothetical protein
VIEVGVVAPVPPGDELGAGDAQTFTRDTLEDRRPFGRTDLFVDNRSKLSSCLRHGSQHTSAM